jgi:ribosome recycling factor
MEKDKKMTEDELKEAEKETQKLTDEHITMVDDLIKHKEKEIMEV